jgi:predicted RNase H-like HicB family nuclease
MLTYKAMYKFLEQGVHGEVLDFPGVISWGNDLAAVRRSLASALVDMAEVNLSRGESLPLPNELLTEPEADLEELMLEFKYIGEKYVEPVNTLDALMLKAIIKESVREVMREEWFKFFEMLIPYVDDVEQADIEATFNPVDYKDDDFVDITDWFNHEAQD